MFNSIVFGMAIASFAFHLYDGYRPGMLMSFVAAVIQIPFMV